MNQIYNLCILVYFHHGVWVKSDFYSWNDSLSNVVAFAYNPLRRQSRTVMTSSKASKAGWSTLWLFSQVGLWITLFIIKENTKKQNKISRNIYESCFVLVNYSWSLILLSCSDTIGAKCFFFFSPQVSRVSFFLIYPFIYFIYPFWWGVGLWVYVTLHGTGLLSALDLFMS